jgi:hypothetical protein
MTTTRAEGGCLCGAIRYRVTGKPTNSMVCHCRTCRRVAAAPVLAWLTFARADFELLRGTPAEFRSSPPVRRTFRARCGTPLTYEHDEEPGFVETTTCSLDEPDAFPPTHHSWLEHDLEWVRFGDGLPAFAESRYPKSD